MLAQVKVNININLGINVSRDRHWLVRTSLWSEYLPAVVHHWNDNVAMLNKFSPLAAPENNFINGSDNGLAPNRKNAMIRTNDGQRYWRIYVSWPRRNIAWCVYGLRNVKGLHSFNWLWPNDAIWRQRSGSTLAQVMACCLTAPSHCLNQCWLIISKVLWHSSEGIIMRRSEDTNQQNKIENYIFRIAFRSPKGQWVKMYQAECMCTIISTLLKAGHFLHATKALNLSTNHLIFHKVTQLLH